MTFNLMTLHIKKINNNLKKLIPTLQSQIQTKSTPSPTHSYITAPLKIVNKNNFITKIIKIISLKIKTNTIFKIFEIQNAQEQLSKRKTLFNFLENLNQTQINTMISCLLGIRVEVYSIHKKLNKITKIMIDSKIWKTTENF